jgi:hypothetical protein
MSGNFLEQLVAEWYEYRGYFVRRNVLVGKRISGGHDGELDVVAFHPVTRHLVHIEPSMDTDSWAKREERYIKKFALGRTHIPELFAGLDLTREVEQIAVMGYGSRLASRRVLGGGKVMLLAELMEEIRLDLSAKPYQSRAVPEQFALLRALQLAANFWLAMA